MSLLRINHETLYTYARPVRLGTHRLVLRPREGHDQQVERMNLQIEPDHHLEWHRDLFGNSVATVAFLTETDHLRIQSEVDLRRFELPCIPEAIRGSVPFPLTYDDIESTVAAAYLQPIYPAEASRVKAWAAQILEGKTQTDAMRLLDSLNQAVRKAIKYKRREEKGVQTPTQTLEKSAGSCRDMATLLMEACRSLAIASRFSSGYLDCPASHAGQASTHAWCEVYLPGQGWLGFDPTLGESTSAKHITIGLSNHPRGVMPVSGTFFGSPTDYIEMKVSVKFTRLPFKSDAC
jgi:transglutaminase-like putative cysteine protease